MKKLKGYICGNDPLDISIGATDIIIYPSIEALKKERTCWDECGIIEITIGEKFVVGSTQSWNKKKNENDSGTTDT